MALLEKEAIEIFSHSVFNSHDLELSINEVYKFFKRYFPLDFMNLPIYDAQLGTLRYRAFVTDEGVILADETVRLSKAAQKEALKVISQKVISFGDFQRHSITREVAAHLGIDDNGGASIALVIELGPSRYGVLGLAAWGEDPYKGMHLKLLEELYEPIASTVRHILSQLEIISLKQRLIRENQDIRKRLMGQRFIGAVTGLKEVMSLVEQSAPLDVPVLIMGETGVGKEVVANAIHHLSKRSDGPMVSINCGAIPDNLLDSELFGHEKGAFTGADSLKQGYFEQADRGTIFMDEIGELTLQAQVKLLRVLQDMTFHRVGGKRPISVDVRVVAATNRDLTNLITNLQFRKDLWFRLNVFPIHIPPLRERKIDIPALAEYFIRRQTIEMNLPYKSQFTPGAIEQLQDYDWPGNVRELQNIIERALIISRGEPLSFPSLVGVPREEYTVAIPQDPVRYLTLDEIIDKYIRQTLVLTKGRISGKRGAANLLGINPSTLRARMKKLGIL